MADLNKIIDELSTLTVVEAAELSKQLRRKMGSNSSRTSCSSTSRRSSSTSRRGKIRIFTFFSSSWRQKN